MMNIDDLSIETLTVESLIPAARNSRTHNDAQVAQIAASIREFGFTNPVLIGEDNDIIAGHGRVLAARKLGLDNVPCIRLSHLTDIQKRAYMIADNKLALNAGWNLDLLRLEIEDLQTMDFEIPLLGFDDQELGALFNNLHENINEDEVPDKPTEPRTQRGQVWLLGDHRLMFGDSTVKEDVDRLMNGRKADLWLTDPPYNVDYTGEGSGKKIQNDNMKDSDFRSFLTSAFKEAFAALKPGASYYIWHADSEGYNFRGAVRDCMQTVRQCLIWQKDHFVMGKKDYHWMHEPCLYGWKDGASHGWYSDRTQTTLMRFEKPLKSLDHPTMKPVKLFAYQIGNSTAPQGLVLDTFAGSGTSIIAPEQLGRTCYSMELDPGYCDVIVNRWQTLTGKVAILEENAPILA